jgi:serine/threonine protein kinase
MLHKSKINEYSMAEQVKIETESGFKLNHPLILTMYDVFHDEKRFYFMLEYAPHGQLYRFLQKVRRFTDRVAASVNIFFNQKKETFSSSSYFILVYLSNLSCT